MFKKWLIFHGFFKNARVIDFDESPKGEKMIFLDQLLKKASVQGPNLTSYKFQTKWRGSDFWLTAQYVVNFQHSGAGLQGLQLKAHFVVQSISVVHLEREK